MTDEYTENELRNEQGGVPENKNRYSDAEITSLISFYDQEEIIPNCTVQILKNTYTGEVSVGWWRNEPQED